VLTEAIRPRDTAGELLARLAVAGAELLVATLDGIEAGTVVARAQPADGVSLAPKLRVEDARIDWQASAVRVDRLARAASPDPGAWTTFRGQRLKVGPVLPLDSSTLAPGRLSGDLHVGTGTHDVALGEVQAAGKPWMAAEAWARGARLGADDRLS
jgi:methionyl-tRNA formyltransferase